MADLEERLRTAVLKRSDRFEPSADLPDRIDARVRRRRRTRQLVTGGLAAMAAAAAVLVVVLVSPGGQDEGSIQMTGRDGEDVQNPPEQSSTTTSGGRASSSTSTTSSSTTTLPPETSSVPGMDFLTEQTRQGIGPITAGMTIRQAQAAAGATITPSYTGSGTCHEAQVQGLEATGLVLVFEPAGADVMDGIVRAVAGSVAPTEEGVLVGQSRDEVVAILGQPTRTEDRSVELGPGPAELLVFESGGYAYGVVVVDGMVYGVQSGDPAWVGDLDGCPGSGPG